MIHRIVFQFVFFLYHSISFCLVLIQFLVMSSRIFFRNCVEFSINSSNYDSISAICVARFMLCYVMLRCVMLRYVMLLVFIFSIIRLHCQRVNISTF